MVVDGFEVDVERAAHGDCFVRPDLVEELPVGLDFEAELVAVVDLVPVEVLVLERAEGAFADAVLVRALASGADVDQLGALLDVGGEADRLEARAVVGDEAIGRISPLTASASSSASGRPVTRSLSVIACSTVSIASR